MGGWNGWYHCMCNTFGTWLPGDPRGFRTRHHREHVEGDYKNPPPAGVYERRHTRAMGRLSRLPVILDATLREKVLSALLDSFRRQGVEVLALSVSAMHMHVLARFPQKPTFSERGLHGKPSARRTSAIDDPVRHYMGLAKQWSSKQLMRAELIDAPLWAKRGKIVAVTDRRHQVNVFRYILRHGGEDAAVWWFRDPVPDVT